jgi:hypothetical protein
MAGEEARTVRATLPLPHALFSFVVCVRGGQVAHFVRLSNTNNLSPQANISKAK